ncbi:MAG: endonuclease MutS2, partial [Clostridia bacterium]|nr:endonuclease MutS2 [Clostridia bacterium]
MPFSQKTLSTLEYDKIIASLAECCATEGARALAYALLPSDDPELVKKRQDRCAAARRLIGHKGYPPFTAPEDVLSSCDRADKGATLSTGELLHISALLHSARGTLDYHNADRPFGTALDEHFARLQTARPLESAIDRAIKAEDMIADEASPALADIRRKIRQTNNKIKDILQSYTGSTRAAYLQDNVVTMRNGRYVVPVKAEYKNDVKGLVHDSSSSGATLFIEPMAVIGANNELRTLQSREEREIERILAELSAAVSEQSGILRLDYHTITELAFYYAEGSLADKMRANQPVIADAPLIDLKRARHPLIDPKKVVPTDVSLGDGYDTLIITGPNTGGKTVTLKTLGLFVLMAQAGLQIPAEESSRIGVFRDVLADIGDEQSIEQSLSTFSSHMVNIVGILGSVGEGTLVLFDELGAGTDPIEGAALAVSILEEVRRSGAKTAATTHYAELKAYALETEGVQNASCEFDVDTLRPTYKLIVGTPGKSNAFAISERLGLPENVVNEARTRVSNENRRFENVIERLESDRIAMERNREQAERLRAEFEQFKREAEEKLKVKLAASEKEIEAERERARQLINSARANSEFVFKQLEDIRKKQESGQFARELADARAAVREALKRSDDVYSS